MIPSTLLNSAIVSTRSTPSSRNLDMNAVDMIESYTDRKDRVDFELACQDTAVFSR